MGVGWRVQAARQWLAPEEAELQDVERQMEEELVLQHMHVERVIAQRADPDGTPRYLVKVRGFPLPSHPWIATCIPLVCSNQMTSRWGHSIT
jgi:hypothetical protein